VIFHLAAQPLVRVGHDDPTGTFDTNVTGTINVLEAARVIDRLRAVVVVTSDKAYAPAEGRPLPEGAHLGGSDPYSASKACADIIAHAYAHSFPTHAVIATARAGNVIGGGDWSEHRLIPDLVRALRDRRAPVLRNPQAIRPWQHVLEPLAGYLMLAERAARSDLSISGAWNFGPEQGDISVAELVERAMRSYGTEVKWHRDSTPNVELPELRIDSRKARQLLDWRPQFDIDEAIATTMAWYNCEISGGDVAALSRTQIASYARKSEQTQKLLADLRS
jgi:CDP-glucose 4,6-dehydratase